MIYSKKMKLLNLFLFLHFTVFSYAFIPEKVLICGVCKDVASRLEKSTRIMEDIGDLFYDYRIIVYENNSADRTVEMLNEWKEHNPKVYFESETLSNEYLEKVIINLKKNGEFSRPELIARARNKVLDISTRREYEDFKYIIWMDMDFVIYPYLDGIVEAFNTDREWDAVVAYGTTCAGDQNTWDWYALRDAIYPIGAELLGGTWWEMPKTLKFEADDEWYPVYSAFGGCGIYKKSSITGCRYSGIVTEDVAAIAEKIIENGRSASHVQIEKYREICKHLNSQVELDPCITLSQEIDLNTGILFGQSSLIWRVDAVYGRQFPSICEHVAFHASMIARGHEKIFINPRLKFCYGG